MLAQLLKTQTRTAHQQLDHHPLLIELLGDTLSHQKYADILIAFYAVHRECEHLLQGAAALFSPHDYLQSCSRLPLLELDLADLGKTPVLRTKKIEVNIDTAAAFTGMAYVVEGSALGGQFIARRLQKHSLDLPVRFFSSNGIDVQKRWELFWDFAEHYCAVDQHETALIAALSTFEFYRKHFDNYCASTGLLDLVDASM